MRIDSALAATTSRLSVADAVVPAWSVTVTTTLVAPAALGVPEITPDDDKLSPAGRLEPDPSAQLYGLTPPEAARLVEYAELTVPLGRRVIVMESAGTLGGVVDGGVVDGGVVDGGVVDGGVVDGTSGVTVGMTAGTTAGATGVGAEGTTVGPTPVTPTRPV